MTRPDLVILPPRDAPDEVAERLSTQAERHPRSVDPLFQSTDHDLRRIRPVLDEARREGRALPRGDRLTDPSQQR
jgi:hypothetical protein